MTFAGDEVMQRFSKAELCRLSDAEKAARCDELARSLTPRIKGTSGSEFHERVGSVVAELRALGHDLWSLDASDDMEAWGPDYVNPTGPGLVITFYGDDDVDVAWNKQ